MFPYRSRRARSRMAASVAARARSCPGTSVARPYAWRSPAQSTVSRSSSTPPSCPTHPELACNPMGLRGAPIPEGGGMRLDGLDEDDARRQYTEFFSARYDLVRRTAYLMCGDWHRADDITQIAFVRLAAAWPRIRDRQSLDAFVRTCLVRVYLSETRRAWYRRESVFAEPPDQPGADPDPGETVTRR